MATTRKTARKRTTTARKRTTTARKRKVSKSNYFSQFIENTPTKTLIDFHRAWDYIIRAMAISPHAWERANAAFLKLLPKGWSRWSQSKRNAYHDAAEATYNKRYSRRRTRK